MMSKIIEHIRSLWKESKYEMVCELANELISSDERNAEAWWYLALAQHSLLKLQESASSLKTLLKLTPEFAEGWAQYGIVLAANQKIEQGLKALSHALQLNPNQTFAARQAARICREQKDLNGEIHYLTQLDVFGLANGNDLIQLGNVYYAMSHFGKAIDYYRRSAAQLKSWVPYYNLAIVYKHKEISQDVDAIDCLERVLVIDNENQDARNLLNTIKPRLEKLAQSVLRENAVSLPKEEWYNFYINPFELLIGRNHNYNIDSLDAKQIQRFKRKLLHEIELEDGEISYIEGLTIDKSLAIRLCEELNDERLKKFHWLVFSVPQLLGFLTRGDITHFLCLENYRPLDILEELDRHESDFREWLSLPFSRQYDLVLTRALQNKQAPLIESLFDGRRWMLNEHLDQCFESVRRQVEKLLHPLKSAADRAKEVKPLSSEITAILNQGGLISIINMLPEPFRDQQSEAVSLIREIAITVFNKHRDTDLSKEILTLSDSFAFKSPILKQQLTEDFNQIEKLIAEEQKHECKLMLGKEKVEITKNIVRQGATIILTENVDSIRWGVLITGTQYHQTHQFLMVCRNDNGIETIFSWRALDNLEKQKNHFNDLVNAAINYVLPKIYEKIHARLDAGHQVKIGPCFLARNALVFEKSGWFSSKQMTIPWSRVETGVSNGVLYVYDQDNPKTRVEMEIRDTENAVILQLLANSLK